MTIGERLKKWRIDNNLTTTDIKEKTGISTGGLSDYENDNKLIGSKTLLKLAENYDIDITYILTGVRKERLNLTENEKEMLEIFRLLPEREQVKMIGRLEDKAKEIENDLRQNIQKDGNLSG